jgi:tyrosine-protein phosphatase SIW14
MKVRVTGFFACYLAGISLVAAPPTAHIPNFIQVNPTLYRGGQPSPAALQELGALGVKRVIDLREPTASTQFEHTQLAKLGIEYRNIPFREFGAPTPEQMESVLRLLLAPKAPPTFLHCRRGKDRTGTVVACYRIQHDGWSNERALSEARANGMSRLERAMQSYVLQFTPVFSFPLVRPSP